MALNILVIDDIAKNRTDALARIRTELGDNGSVAEFPVSTSTAGGMHEVRLANDLASVKEPVSLIVADRDLSSYSEYSGLSESTVRRVADTLGIPECGYARGEDATSQEFVQEGVYREACIRIALDNDFAKKVVAIARGFSFIEESLRNLQDAEKTTPASKTLAKILGKPELADKFSLYASGDQSRLSSLVRHSGNEPTTTKRRLSCFLGYWLWDSILRFPGIVVNEVAASSCLDIDQEEFKADEVQALFAKARYHGPFEMAQPPLWWRSTLDDIIGESGETSGRDYTARQLSRTIGQSKCCENSSVKAGYYCFLTGQPVSYENSKPGLWWFPRGADLTRISKTVYDEKVPWL